MYEYFDHTADAGFHVVAATREELFEDAARALFNLIVEDLDTVQPAQRLQVQVSGSNDTYLLFDWLNELLYLHDTQGLVFAHFAVTFTPQGLSAEIQGEPLNPARHRTLHEVKAITYHGLEMIPSNEGWEATVIVDI